MTGVIKTFLPEKEYGFIKGDDNKDYFFHVSNIDKSDRDKVGEEALVSFTQKATPKGYSAIKISINSEMIDMKYTVPDTIYTSKEWQIKGWKNIDISEWTVSGSSRHSPDDAKQDMLDNAQSLNVNALLNVSYYKSTGSESGTGSGTHYFTIHHYKGTLANIAKKSLNGNFEKEELTGINYNAMYLKKELIKKSFKGMFKFVILWLTVIATILISWSTHSENALWITLGAIFIGMLLNPKTDHGSWLEKAID